MPPKKTNNTLVAPAAKKRVAVKKSAAKPAAKKRAPKTSSAKTKKKAVLKTTIPVTVITEQPPVAFIEVPSVPLTVTEESQLYGKDLSPVQKRVVMYASIAVIMAAIVLFWANAFTIDFSSTIAQAHATPSTDGISKSIDALKQFGSEVHDVMNTSAQELKTVPVPPTPEEQVKNNALDSLTKTLEDTSKGAPNQQP